MSSEYPNLEPIQCAGKENSRPQCKALLSSLHISEILLSNVQSLMNKLEKAELCLKNELVDIACICESWSTTEDVVAFERYAEGLKDLKDWA